MPDSLLDALESVHPTSAEQMPGWERYRAFGDSMVDMSRWPPRGRQESSVTYETRLSLTHSLGFSRAAMRRIQGVLTGKPASRAHDAGDLPSNIVERLTSFDKDCDRTGTAIEGLCKELLGSALTMGLAGTTVDKPTANAADESEDPLPFLTMWGAEEIRDWEVDANGLLLWVKMRRDVTTAASPTSSRAYHHVWRIYDRDGGQEYRQQYDPQGRGETASPVVLVGEWSHGLGVVPFSPMFARRRGVMRGESYIDELSLADWRKLQFDSDQSMASYLHASPQLTIKTTADLDEVGVGTSHVLKLNPELNEDASYLETDTGGMQVREALIDSAVRQGFNLAGIDPASVTPGYEGGGARSGTSLAWSFSTSEAPTLAAISEELERWDRSVHEIVTRYLIAGDLPPAFVELYDGSISRVRSWDLMSAERSSDLALGAWELVKSPTWRRVAAQDIAVKVPGNIPDEQASQIKAELADADYSVPAIPSDMDDIR